MKLSNKILIGVIGFAFIYITAAFTEIRYFGDPHRLNKDNSLLESIDIPELRYIVLQNIDKRIRVIGSESAGIEVRSLSGNALSKLKYKISNDTLSLMGLELENDSPFGISIKVSNHQIRQIKSDGISLIVENLKGDTISLVQKSGWTTFHKNNVFDQLDIAVSDDGNLNLIDMKLKSLVVELNESRAMVFTPIVRLTGSMKNNSRLHLSGAEEIQFKKDSTCSLYLN